MIQTRPVRLHITYVPAAFAVRSARRYFRRFTILLWGCTDDDLTPREVKVLRIADLLARRVGR
jgi:hypothetical protein